MRVGAVGPSHLGTGIHLATTVLILSCAVGQALPKCPPPWPGETQVNQLIALLDSPNDRAKGIEGIYQLARNASSDIHPQAKQKGIRALGRKKIAEAEGTLRILWNAADTDPELADQAYIAWLELRQQQEASRAPRVEMLWGILASEAWSCSISQYLAEELLDLGVSEAQDEIESTIRRCPSPSFRVNRDLAIARTKLSIMREHSSRVMSQHQSRMTRHSC